MIVDIYTHFMPPQVLKSIESLGGRSGMVKRMAAVRELHDLDARLRAMDALGDYRQIISLSNLSIETITTPAQGRDLARVSNDAMADMVRRHPDRFPAFVAALPLHDMDSNLEELKRAIETLGACGIQIFTNVNGRPLDNPQFEPLFAAMEQHDLPIWLHPARTAAMTDYPAEQQSRFEMWWCFGWPYETSVAMSRLVLSGLFDRHPKLKIITHHLGGMIPYFDKRIEDGMALLGTRTQSEDYSGIIPSLKRPLIDYFHMFYGDTALFGASRGLACGLDFFGADHVVFASDAPFGPVASTRDAVSHLDLEKTQLDAIFHRNAEKLINRGIA
ncbi:MAG: amidohydrolase [Acidobacteriia bacterium]|nr:amidohydrolase [Terriglobia bacterium]